MKTLYLINHSHTDIGYTAVQELIMQYHVDFINQAIEIIEQELKKKINANIFGHVKIFGK